MENQKQNFHWPPLESNPDIFTAYLHKIGLSSSTAVGEVFGFDEELLAFLPQPIHAVIVNMKRLKKDEDRSRGDKSNVGMVDFYMKQTGTLDNACGIIAAIHCVLNSEVEIATDSVLGKFKTSTKNMTPMERCIALENNVDFKEAHIKSAREGSTNIPDTQAGVEHHFVAFIVKNGTLIELDGTKQGPHLICECHDVLRGSIQEIKRRLSEGEITDSLSMMTLNAAL